MRKKIDKFSSYNLKEGKLYYVKYLSIFSNPKIIIGYLININLDGDLMFSDKNEKDNLYSSENDYKIIPEYRITEIREIKEKGEALALQAVKQWEIKK